MLVIDGSHGEGGGQILRSALTLAALAGQPVRIEAIRAGRDKPGLQAQHVTAVQAAAAVCSADVRGGALGSTTLEFIPGGPPRPGEYVFDVAEARHGSSAGSAMLVFQTVFLPLATAGGPSRLVIRGGTHVPWSPPAPYVKHVFLPAVWPLGLRAEMTLKRYGWYPAGGGEVEFQIEASRLKPDSPRPPTGGLYETCVQRTERGELDKVWGLAAVSNLPSHIAQRMANRAVNVLRAAGLEPIQIEAAHVEADGPGVGLFLWASYQFAPAGFCAYGRKGLPAEKVAEAACGELLAHHRRPGATDPHLADQLVLPAALAAGASHWTTSRVTRHLLTNAWVARQFLGRDIDVGGVEGQPGEVKIAPN